MTIQADPRPPYASFRVLVALRLLCQQLPSLVPPPSDTEDNGVLLTPFWAEIDPWGSMINGEREVVSGSNERRVEATMKELCAGMVDAMDKGSIKCDLLRDKWDMEGDRRGKESLLRCGYMLSRIWLGELVVLRTVEHPAYKS
jgi:hypothetical protein